MNVPFSGAIDCDLHLAVPDMAALLPYLDDYWRDQVVTRHLDRMPFTMTSYPPNSPLSVRPDWRPAQGPPGSDLDALRRDALDRFGTRYAICHTLHGALALYHEDMSAALCSAVNDWVRTERLDREPRLRASILVPMHNPARAVQEIERLAGDRRFVQVLVLAMQEMLLGRRIYWPIYAAAEQHGLALGIHAGSIYRVPPTASGWTPYHVEDYVAQSAAFESQLMSLLAEGVFQQFPALHVVLIESGFTWLPTLLWRASKTWRGARPEVPWLDRPPDQIIRERVRLTLQPVDVPDDPALLSRVLEHLGSDRMLLFSTDYPHWQFDGDDVLPAGLSDEQLRRLLVENALETFPRLAEAATAPPPADTREETVR